MALDLNADMLGRWRGFTAQGNLNDEGPQIFNRLVTAYNAPQRHYHNFAHIRHCLDEFETVNEICPQPVAVQAALWFHDVVARAQAKR